MSPELAISGRVFREPRWEFGFWAWVVVSAGLGLQQQEILKLKAHSNELEYTVKTASGDETVSDGTLSDESETRTRDNDGRDLGSGVADQSEISIITIGELSPDGAWILTTLPNRFDFDLKCLTVDASKYPI